jgi:hypothetical protein
MEGAVVLLLVKRLLRACEASGRQLSVGIITPYGKQVEKLQHAVRGLGRGVQLVLTQKQRRKQGQGSARYWWRQQEQQEGQLGQEQQAQQRAEQDALLLITVRQGWCLHV